MTGMQIHGPIDTTLIYPQEFYVVDSNIPRQQEHLNSLRDLQQCEFEEIKRQQEKEQLKLLILDQERFFGASSNS